MPRRYATGTSVSVDSSRGEISGILTKHGVQRMGWYTEPGHDVLQFELDGNSYRLIIERPTLEQVKDRYVREGGRWNLVYDPAKKVEDEWRRRWRANVLLLKAKLEFADEGSSTLARELMAYRVLADGRTLEEAITAGAVPMLKTGGKA
jgi:hypothetical protein